MSQPLLWLACRAWASVPDLTLARSLAYPDNKVVLFFEFLAAYLGIVLIVVGLDQAVSGELSHYSGRERLSVLVVPLTLTWVWNENYFYLLIVMFFSLLDNTARTFSTVPDSDLETWAANCLSLYSRLRGSMNLPLLVFMSVRYKRILSLHSSSCIPAKYCGFSCPSSPSAFLLVAPGWILSLSAP